MVKSQLKQLKIALRDAGISTSNRRRKRKKLAKQEDRTSILENIRSQFNHYEKKVNKVKYEVGGRKIRGIEGYPGLSRQAGEEKRRNTILKDMLRRNKEGSFVDHRFGEHNTHLSLEEKMLQRYAVEKQKLYEKNNIYNLNEDVGNFGESPIEIEDFENDTENDSGNIDFETVNDEHFGGFDNSEQLNNNMKKSKSEVMKEIIEKSKLRKYERQKEKQEDEMKREMLDAEFNDLHSLLAKNDKSISSKIDQEQTNKDIQYDLSVKELAFEKRACPSSRTKTEEEIVQEKAEELQRLEEERLKRMNYEYFFENDIKKTKSVFSKGDNLEDDYISDNDNESDNDTKFHSFKEYKYEKTNGVLYSMNSTKDDLNLNLNKATDDFGTCNDLNSESRNATFESSNESQDLDLGKKKELAYVYPCPGSISEFLSILKNIEQEDIPKVVDRIKVLHHPSLHPLNKEKLQTFIAVLLDLILYLSEKKSVSLVTLDILSEHLRDLSYKYPEASYDAFHKKLTNTRERFNQLIFSEKTKSLPSIQDLIFLRIIGVIFPTSDLSHVIVTPTFLIMGQLLSQLKIISLGDIVLKLYIITLFAEYINISKRIVPEAINTLFNILKILFKKNNRKLDNKEISTDSGNILFGLQNKPRALKISDIYSNDDNDKELEVSLFKTTAQLIDYYAILWSGKSAFIEIFSPCLNLLKEFYDKISLSCELLEEINSINQRITKLLQFSFETRKPLMLQAHKPIPIPSFIPKFEKEYSLDKKSYDPDRERAKSAKLRSQYRDAKRSAIRMLRLDGQFIARETQKMQREKDAQYAAKIKRIHGQLTQKD
ncbi:hypothetical protein T552_01255 [Pneumocystis carinii B80]|uniref:Nucleolar protein 14 n=1 Tax=Pneumocystis carinii (strain B80) TaxID=1408658 RepID=A0A0W4ZLR4_PNEC8|nr:hypothetical protein T552_01255 [Pneumocystis carinii B80]KTW29300.1 hypothetical protein T552_01255 [Pneumocystis carinii B80]